MGLFFVVYKFKTITSSISSNTKLVKIKLTRLNKNIENTFQQMNQPKSWS